jgi:hypothetical protein
MVLKDVLAFDGRIFLKSEWGPIGDDWPAVSFSKRSVGERLRADFNPDRDVIIYVGTSNAEFTKDPRHRQRLLSAVKVEPNAILETRRLIAPDVWARVQKDFGVRWEFSMAVLRAWSILALPLARDLVPESYRKLGWRDNWGNVVEVVSEDRDALLDVELTPVRFAIQSAGGAFDPQRALLGLDEATKKEIARMAAGIRQRVAQSGTTSTRTNPLRLAESELHVLLATKLREQDSKCALCAGPLTPAHSNRLLHWSADRIDSSVPSYDAANIHITHLGCNLAKNDVTMSEFEEWLTIVRNVTKP